MQRCLPPTIIVTGADSTYFNLQRDMIASLHRRRERGIALGVLDLGFTAAEREWIAREADAVVTPSWDLAVPPECRTLTKLGCAARPFLRRYFPGFELYLWLDADLWVQDWQAIERYLDGAAEVGAALACESEPAYRFQAWLSAWTLKHFLNGWGIVGGLRLFLRSHLNAGAFAMHRDAPHWDAWRDEYQRAIDRTGLVTPYDQFALNAVIYNARLPTAILDPACNWIVDRGEPTWNAELRRFCKPDAPQQPLGILHLAGPAKRKRYRIAATDGTTRTATYRLPGASDGAVEQPCEARAL